MDISSIVFIAKLLKYNKEARKTQFYYGLVTRYQEPPFKFIDLYNFQIPLCPPNLKNINFNKFPNTYFIDKLYPIDTVISIKLNDVIQFTTGEKRVAEEDGYFNFSILDDDLEKRVRLIRKFCKLDETKINDQLCTVQISKCVFAMDKDIPMLRLQEVNWIHALKKNNIIVDLATLKRYSYINDDLRFHKIEEGMEYATSVCPYQYKMDNYQNKRRFVNKMPVRQLMEQIIAANDILNPIAPNEITEICNYQKKKY